MFGEIDEKLYLKRGHSMKILLLSGGDGKRLWPLSNNSNAKQFIRLFPKQKWNETINA